VQLLSFLPRVSTQVSVAESIRIAAASDLVFCMEELNAEFSKRHAAVEIKLSIGSSGNFFAQIQRGAPFDVFLSADMRYPSELVKMGQAEAGSSLHTQSDALCCGLLRPTSW
jgi:molybdate transport system substrate-binding protein